MLINGQEHYPIETAVQATGYSKDNLIELFNDKKIPGKFVNSEYVFSAGDIQNIKLIKKGVQNAATLGIQKKYPDPNPILTGATISLAEAVEKTGYKASTLRNYFDSGKIDGHLINKKLYFTPDQVEKIIKLKQESQKPKSDLQKVAEKQPGVKLMKEVPAKKPERKNHNAQLSDDAKKKYACAKVIAKSRNQPVMEYLLTAATPDIEKKKDALKVLRS